MIWFWLFLALTVVSFFVLLIAWTKYVANSYGGFEDLSDFIFVAFETIVCTLLWPVFIIPAILYLCKIRIPLHKEIPRVSRFANFLNRLFGDEEK